VWPKAREGRKKMSKKWLKKLKTAHPILAEKAIEMNERDGFLMPGEKESERRRGSEREEEKAREKGKGKDEKGRVEEIGRAKEGKERQEDRETRNGYVKIREKEDEAQEWKDKNRRSGSTDVCTNARTDSPRVDRPHEKKKKKSEKKMKTIERETERERERDKDSDNEWGTGGEKERHHGLQESKGGRKRKKSVERYVTDNEVENMKSTYRSSDSTGSDRDRDGDRDRDRGRERERDNAMGKETGKKKKKKRSSSNV
jgi:hypothetical protein